MAVAVDSTCDPVNAVAVLPYEQKVPSYEKQNNFNVTSRDGYGNGDSPACRLYDFYMKRCGGKQVGKLTRAWYFDGKYHDSIIYELLAEDICWSKGE